MMLLACFFLAFTTSLILVPVLRKSGLKTRKFILPRGDRWRMDPVSRLGGVAIFTAFLAAVLLVFIPGELHGWWPLLLCCSLMFLVGLLDDFHPLSPHAKFVAQITVSALAIAFGYTTRFFTPRIENEIVAQIPNILLTFLWLVGITNAFNLLDNMDGLAAGIALIASGILSYFFLRSGNLALSAVSLSLAGAVAGFLIFNFPPASIFMGDNGSHFLGFTLAILAISRQPQASNVLAVIGVPILLFLLPILDTALVTFTRLLRGQSPFQGGRDHASHRLIAFGFSESQTLLALYGIALVSGVAAALLESIRYWYSLVLAPILVLILAVLFAHIGGIKILPPESKVPMSNRFTKVMLDLTFRKRLLEVTFDFFLVSVTYYLAFLVSNGLRMNVALLGRFLASLPVVVISAYILFFVLGIYRIIWRYIGLREILRLLMAAFGCAVFAAGLSFILETTQLEIWHSSDSPSPLTLVLFAIFLFVGLASSRSSFRVLELLKPMRKVQEDLSVLIYGAGEEGLYLLDWLRSQSGMAYRPVGFIDDDPLLIGRWVHGLKVWGGLDRLDSILTDKHIAGIILVGSHDPNSIEELVSHCRTFNCWVRKLSINSDTITE